MVRRVESALGVPFCITFAQIEVSPWITPGRLGDSPEDRAATLGRAHPHVEIMIADACTGQPVPAGPIGEILTRGYHLLREYLDNPRRPVGRSRPTAGCAPETSARPTSAGTAGSRAGSRR